ncbi:MAG: PAS domain S-box protein [Magnetospirillum sp.]|nr:PAS domain S-box protein [Magnetospirillum sp.]
MSQSEYDCPSENPFRALFEHAAVGMALVTPHQTIIHINRALTASFGFTGEEFIHLNFADLTHPDDRDGDREEARRLVRREIDSYTRENRYRRKDGSYFWGRITASVVPGDSSQRFAVVMIEDIDERKRADANLSLFRKLVDAAQEAVVILTPDSRIVYANPACGQLFGIPAEQLAESDFHRFFPSETWPTVDETILPALWRGEEFSGIVDAVDSSGHRFPLLQRAGVVREQTSGAVKFAFAFMDDHSPRQAFEDQLYDAMDAAEEANIAKTRFLAAASHDLRQPMQALAMFAAVLAGRTTDPGQSVLVARIQDSVAALESLLNGLLDVSKLEAGLVVPQEADFCVGALMNRLAGEFTPLAEAEGIRLSVIPSQIAVHSDPALLERILRNLLGNAVRYTHQGRIVFGCRRVASQIRFEVWDTGIGIPATELKNIFREFHQVGNPHRDRRQGLGLGLAIVERLARLLGHRIDVHSVEGRGSTFAVAVPRATETLRRPNQLPLGLSARGASVVVIDDERDVLEGLALMLDAWGHVVIPGTDATEVIARLTRTPDLIVADYRLRNGDTGGQAIERIERHLGAGIRIPAIILTGDTAPERLRQARLSGHRLLHKPVQPDALRAAVDDALASRRRRNRQSREPIPPTRTAKRA